MQILIKIVITILPVLLFTVLLVKMDGFRLVRKIDLLAAILSGALCAFFAFGLDALIFEAFGWSYSLRTVTSGPIVEEFLKTAAVVFFIARARVGFTIDAAVIGFAVGAAFASIENVLFVRYASDSELGVVLARGFGAAFMHAGVSAAAAVATMFFVNKSDKFKLIHALPGAAIAVVLHLSFNGFYFSPPTQAIIGIIVIPTLFVVLFAINSKSLSRWITAEFDDEVELLMKIKRGEFSGTEAGKYFLSIKDKFDPETVVDMLAYIRIASELSLRAKTALMLAEAEMESGNDGELESKFIEMKTLQKNIGQTGMLALAPILPSDRKRVWKTEYLKAMTNS